MSLRAILVLLVGFLVVEPIRAQSSIQIVTMNCYWFIGHEKSSKADPPRTTTEYSLKAGHLIGLLPDQPALFIGLQEIGNDQDVQSLAQSAKARYHHSYQPLFVQGKDTATKQDVGALLDISTGWGIHGRPARVSELEKELSKHLVVRLTNASTAMDICVVHLRRAIGDDGVEKQRKQNQALVRWSMRHLASNPKANVVILGDFNEGYSVGSEKQTLGVLFNTRPPMVDALSTLRGKIRTHADGKAYDRIIVSDAIAKGYSRLKLMNVQIQEHRHGKGEERRLYTDHFPVVGESDNFAITDAPNGCAHGHRFEGSGNVRHASFPGSGSTTTPLGPVAAQYEFSPGDAQFTSSQFGLGKGFQNLKNRTATGQTHS